MLFVASDWKLNLCIALLMWVPARSDEFIKNGSFEKSIEGEPADWFKAAVRADGLKMWLAAGSEDGQHFAAIRNTHKYDKPVANNWCNRSRISQRVRLCE